MALGASTDTPTVLLRDTSLRRGLADRVFMTSSTLIRMAVGLLVFVLLARLLGPLQFGLFATVFAYAILAGFITDFGNTIKVLRDIAADPAKGGETLSQALTMKAFLTAFVGLAGAIIVAFLPVDATVKLSCAVLGAAVLIGSVAELAQVAFRSLGRYADETWIVLWTSLVHGGVLGATALLNPTILAVALAFLLSRLIYLVITLIGILRLFPRGSIRPLAFGRTLMALKDSRTWALDSGLGYFSNQVDGLIVAHMLGLGPAGVYQAGNRFVQSTIALGMILSNIHLPRLAAKGKPHATLRTEWRMVVEFVVLAIVFAAALVIAGPWVTRYLLGPRYAEVNQLWLGFGAFLGVRLMAASFGGALSAQGRPGTRVAIQLVSLASILLGLWISLPRYGIEAAPWVMAAGGGLTALLYAAAFMGLFDTRTRHA
jgi:O-antigen/teichoic acid export membrane protein